MSDKDTQTIATADVAALSTAEVVALSTAGVAALSTADVAALENDEAIADQELAAAIAAVSKPAATPAKQKAAPAAAQAKAAPAPQAAPAAVGITASLALGELQNYIAAMAPRKPITVEEGCRWQLTLYRAVTTIINRTDDDFKPAFSALLKLFEEHADAVFSETHVFRFFDNIQLPENDRKAFQRLINLIKLLAPVKGRELALKQVDFNRSLEHGVLEQAKQRLLAHFNL